jgi:hypothetical protein
MYHGSMTGELYRYRYFKDADGRSVQLRQSLTASKDSPWVPVPAAPASYTTFDNSRLAYASSAGLPSLGRSHGPSRR